MFVLKIVFSVLLEATGNSLLSYVSTSDISMDLGG